jgi:hypothetical protein
MKSFFAASHVAAVRDGADDAVMLVESNARSYAARIPHAELTIFPGDVRHHVFVANCTEAGRATLPALCLDAPDVNRGGIHAKTTDLAEEFFARHLR